MASYEEFLRSVGITASQVWEMSNNSTDRVPFNGKYPVKVCPSDIHGVGLFATRDMDSGERICPARLYDKRTPAGRFINHSGEPNTYMEVTKQGFYLVAREKIRSGDELTSDYLNNNMLLRRAAMDKEEALLQQGSDAEILLNTEAFTRTINALVDVSVQAFLSSAPDQNVKREEAYNHYRALTDVVSTLRQQVEVRDQINAKETNQEEE